MDAKKFGTFIATLRKENNMTQVELAQKLQVTDKAVSKWERGLGFRAADRPRLRLIPGGQAAAAHREEQKRRAELQQFIKACEALYEKNRASQTIIYLQEDRP